MVEIDLSGKSAVITGGGRGLGAAIAGMLSKAGANVVINYLEEGSGVNRKCAEETAANLGRPAIALEADVRDAKQVGQMLDETIDRFGSLDIIVNNAGVIRNRSIKKMSHEEWQIVIDTNLTGVFNVCKAAAEKINDGGRIVNISSIAGVVGSFGQTNYAAAKAGVIAITKVLSKELAGRNITVNAVAPGQMRTEMENSLLPENIKAEVLKAIPLGRFGEPEEIGKVVTFLCSDFASYISGQVIHVNGGWFG